MKKLLSILLVLGMLLSLAPLALADAEIVEEEPAAEEAEIAVEEAPAAEDAEPPALDGADIKVSGSLNISQVAQDSSLTLKGDTTIVVDRDQTLQGISGGKALTITIQSGKTLTVNNTNGHAIDVYSLTVNGPGTLVVNASRNGLYTDKNIDIAGVSLNVSAGGDGVYSRNGNVSIFCNASVRSTGGCAIYARMGTITVSGELTASTKDDDSPCILSGGTDGSSVSSGYIRFNEGTYTVTANDNAVECSFGDIDITGNLNAASSAGMAIVSYKASVFGSPVAGTMTINGAVIEAKGSTRGISCGGDIVIMDSEIFASGSDYGIYAGSGLTVGARLAVVTPATGRIKGNTVMYNDDVVATTVRIGLQRITGKATLTYPGDRVYVGDTVGLALTDVPSPYRIQWERSEDGWSNFMDIPGETGATYTVRPEDRGWKVQARITADGYGGELYSGGAFVFSRPIQTASIEVTAPEEGASVSGAKGTVPAGANYSLFYEEWSYLNEPVSGTFGDGVYYYTALLKPAEGCSFAGTQNGLSGDISSSVVDAKVNGTAASRIYWYNGSISDPSVSDAKGWIRVYARFECGLPISAENFPDAWFREFVGKYIDTNENGCLSEAERNAVTEIDINGCSDQTYYWMIASLQGIEYFPNLEYLYCNSALSTLDLSKNTKLVEVRLDNDDFDGRGLTALNVTGCTRLESLSLYDNRVASLDLTDNAKLRELNVDGNPLTSLDLSPNTQLESLDVGYCKKLASLDLSGNTKLRRLRISGSGLTSIDVSGLPALEFLHCENCGLTALDVTKNPALDTLYCGHNKLAKLDVTKNPKLKYLDCRDNLLTSLDLSGCPALVRLQCMGNKLTALDLGKNPGLSELYCYGTDIKTLDISPCQGLLRAYHGTYHNERTEMIGGREVAYTFHSASGGVLAVETAVKLTAPAPAEPTVKLSADGKTAHAENYQGLYARVALAIESKGQSGLYISQAQIGSGGSISIPMLPGFTVTAVNVALVPTLADVQSPTPKVKARDSVKLLQE